MAYSPISRLPMGSPRLKESHTDIAIHSLEQAVLGGRTNVVYSSRSIQWCGIVVAKEGF